MILIGKLRKNYYDRNSNEKYDSLYPYGNQSAKSYGGKFSSTITSIYSKNKENFRKNRKSDSGIFKFLIHLIFLNWI